MHPVQLREVIQSIVQKESNNLDTDISLISCKYTVSSSITLFPKIFVMKVPVVVLLLEPVRHQQRHNRYVFIWVRLPFKRDS